jgi:hypothetical protein
MMNYWMKWRIVFGGAVVALLMSLPVAAMAQDFPSPDWSSMIGCPSDGSGCWFDCAGIPNCVVNPWPAQGTEQYIEYPSSPAPPPAQTPSNTPSGPQPQDTTGSGDDTGYLPNTDYGGCICPDEVIH